MFTKTCSIGKKQSEGRKPYFFWKNQVKGSNVSIWRMMIHFKMSNIQETRILSLSDILYCCRPYFHCVLNYRVLGLTSWGSKNIFTKLQPKRELFNCHWSKHMSQSLFDILAQSLIQFFVQQAQQCPLQAYFSDVNIC